MKTPYVRQVFGDDVDRRLRSRLGWVTAGVASSIPWPVTDVCIEYAGDEYFLRGYEKDGKPSSPGITIANDAESIDEAISKIYRFTSILSWFFGGYVDVSGYVSGSHPMLYGDTRNVYALVGTSGPKTFDCSHLPVVTEDHIRKALAFWREGMRLRRVHDSYSFLSFDKVIESQFHRGKGKATWIAANIDRLTGRTESRVLELRNQGVDVSAHLFESGRCAVAHATLEGDIVDPDIPSDRRRLSSDLSIIEDLAQLFISDELKVPNSRTLYESRDRLAPWRSLLRENICDPLGQESTSPKFHGLQGMFVSVGIWPDGPIPGLEHMMLQVDAVKDDVVRVLVLNKRRTIVLVFILDFLKGRVQADLESSGFINGDVKLEEFDVTAYATYFYKALGNGKIELICDQCEPVDCEIIIPVNIIPPSPGIAISEAVERFRANANRAV